MMSYGNSFSTVTRRKSEMKLKFFVSTRVLPLIGRFRQRRSGGPARNTGKWMMRREFMNSKLPKVPMATGASYAF